MSQQGGHVVTTVIVLVVVLLLIAALRLWLTANRLDRLHVRTEAAWVALEGALSRRVVAARAMAAAGGLVPERAALLRGAARRADSADRAHRADAENDLSRALAALPADVPPDLAGELADANERVVLARRFYNDAVRDTLALRSGWFTRFFRLAGRAKAPQYFEIAEYQRRPPVKRLAARVLLFDDHDRVLLFFGIDPRTRDGWWFTAGGGVEDGEDLHQAALREVAEETGLLLDAADLHGPVWRRTASFSWAGSDLEQTEFFFAARTGGFELDTSGFNALERDTVRDHRWWSAADLATTADQVYPVELPNRLGEAVAQLSTHRVIEPVEIS
jgi:8-oxo-dGTP pyrophosphatase MutT (NUDIX family)